MSQLYTVEELFQDIPGDLDNVMLTFPPEIIKETGWNPGDVLSINVENGKLVISKNA